MGLECPAYASNSTYDHCIGGIMLTDPVIAYVLCLCLVAIMLYMLSNLDN
ncbi:hypothetical protein GQ472_01965 [archaeon]|nr:hypothetical protein [archaeon]